MKIFIGLGSNVGDRFAMLKAAVDALRADPDIEVVRASSVYETDPIGPEQTDFLNAAVELDADLSAREVLHRCKVIEKRLGRIPRQRWGPREIDIDLLLYGDRTIDEEDLRVPHGSLIHRAFVLVPLDEIAPGLEVPGAGAVSGLVARVGRDGVRPVSGRLLPE